MVRLSIADYAFFRVGLAMIQAVSRRPVTAEDRVKTRVSSSEICGGKRRKGTNVSPSILVFSNTIIPSMPATHLPLHISKNQPGEAWESPKKSSALSEIE
jgi:hypothetical protein